DTPDGAVKVLVNHRQLLARMPVAHVAGDVVAVGDLPAMLGAGLLVGRDRGFGGHWHIFVPGGPQHKALRELPYAGVSSAAIADGPRPRSPAGDRDSRAGQCGL